MKKRLAAWVPVALSIGGAALTAAAQEIVPKIVHPVMPPPVIRPVDPRADEQPITVETQERVVEENAFFRRVRTTFTFTNPNARQMAGELEFPIPDGAHVCAYALEVNGTLVPGVVCEKEKARVAFENEVRKGVDPGLVEQVKGNIWKTRIFPLVPHTPRQAEVEYVAPKTDAAAVSETVYERDGEDVFAARAMLDEAAPATIAQQIAGFAKGTIVWDASLSAQPFAAAWRKKLEALPEKGEWALVVFNNSVTAYAQTYGFTKESLLKKIDEIVYDGGTDIADTLRYLSNTAGFPLPALLFTDEIDTLGLEKPDYESIPGFVIASRDDVPVRDVVVRKLAPGETPPEGAAVKEGRLLATVWAARRMNDLAAQADARKDEFLALGRKYGVAGPGLSLIVLETLEQWLEHKIEPPANLALHDEWVKRRAAEDDPIAAKKAQAEHEQQLLQYWEERVKWWNDPKPPKSTPKSGLFDIVARAVGLGASRRDAAAAVNAEDVVCCEEAALEEDGVMSAASACMRMEASAPGAIESAAANSPLSTLNSQFSTLNSPLPVAVTLKAWDPKTPYLDALKAAAKEDAYKVYLNERETYGSSPAFYIDCAGWFYKAGRPFEADRILTNLAEFKLEDAALWRAMGWRAREAGSYSLAVRAFRKVLALRGEEAQSRRDLALVLMEQAKAALCDGEWAREREKDAQAIARRNLYDPSDTPDSRLKARLEISCKWLEGLEEAMRLFADAAFNVNARRSGRRGNDFQVSIIALEELNGLIAWVNAVDWPDGKKPAVPAFDAAYRRDLPVKLRIVMSWDADETDIDLHVLEPNGEEAFYGHRRTAEGGFVSEDVTTGYGPEEYLKKELESGVYKVLTNYFASDQTALTGPATVTATVYTDWGTAAEKRQVLTLRLDKPKDNQLIGEVKL